MRDEYSDILNCQAILIFEYDKRMKELICDHNGKSIILKELNEIYIDLNDMEKPKFENCPTNEDIYKTTFTPLIGFPVHNYLIVKRKNLHKEIEEIFLVINKVNFSNDPENFEINDILFTTLLINSNGVVRKFRKLYDDFVEETKSTASHFRRFIELLSCVFFLFSIYEIYSILWVIYQKL